MASELVHSRKIEIKAIDYDEHSFVLLGHLTDFRPYGYCGPHGVKPGPLLVHEIKIRLRLTLGDYEVKEIEVTMPQIPLKACRKILPNFQQLVGVSLLKDFRPTINRMFGRTRGCVHVVSLLHSIYPMAFLGEDADRLFRYGPGVPLPLEKMTDTCHVWTKERLASVQSGEKIE